MKLIFSSSGLKAGPLPEGKDIYLDCRVLLDPTRASYLTTPGGFDPRTQNQITNHDPSWHALDGMLEIIRAGLVTLPNRRNNGSSKPKDTLTVHCFCAWGVHRSVAAKHILSNWMGRRVNNPLPIPLEIEVQ